MLMVRKVQAEVAVSHRKEHVPTTQPVKWV